jgi:hypothetical protein
MNAIMKKTAFILSAAGLIVGSSSCIMEDRIVEFVVHEGTCEEFIEYSTNATFVTPVTVDYADEINRALEDNDISREDMVTARVVSATYEVTQFSHAHDWTIGGSVTIERTDIGGSPEVLFEYPSQSIADALGHVTRVALNPDGVAVINQALDDFIAGGASGHPVFIIRVNNESVTPMPSVSDPIAFLWRACITVHIVTKRDAEVPDPF